MNQQLTEIVFQPYPKTPRLFGNKGVIISEKLDGTNAAIQIIPISQLAAGHQANLITAVAHDCVLIAQSRNRIITPQSDNFNFARWVATNAEGLVEALGTGIHRGEWWGQGIQRGYGLDHKRFSLFAIDRYFDENGETKGFMKVPGLGLVLELYRGRFDSQIIDDIVKDLRENGSETVRGQKAEGVVVYHEASREVFKVMCENDNLAKGEQ